MFVNLANGSVQHGRRGNQSFSFLMSQSVSQVLGTFWLKTAFCFFVCCVFENGPRRVPSVTCAVSREAVPGAVGHSFGVSRQAVPGEGGGRCRAPW